MLWDFRVFTQVYVLQRAGGISRDTNLLGVYAYRLSIGENDFDMGAAIAIVMVVITLLLTLALPAVDGPSGRAHMTMPAPARARHRRPQRLGLFVAAVALFPVYWMVLTSFRRGIDIQSPHPVVPPISRDAQQLPQGVRA